MNTSARTFVDYGDYVRELKPPPPSRLLILPPGSSGSYNCRMSNRWLSTIIHIPGSGRDRPDLVDQCTGEIYEIKQDDDAASAGSDLTYYMTLLETRGGRPYHPGTIYQPPSKIPMVTNYANAWLASPGVILYHVYGDEEKQTSLRTFLAILFALATGGEGVVAAP